MRRRVLVRVFGWNAVQTRRREAQDLHHHRHRVGRVLPAARPGARAADRLDLVQLFGRHLAGTIGAHRLKDRHDRGVALALVHARVDRAVVEDQSGPVEAAKGDCRARDRLVAAHQADDAVEHVAADAQLDRVGDDLATDERGLHALGAHGGPVRNGDGAELHRRAPRRANACLDVLRQPALVVVARHRLDPGRCDTDERSGQVLVVEADGLEHAARRGAVGTVGQGRAVALVRVAGQVVGQRARGVVRHRGCSPRGLDAGCFGRSQV